MDELYEAALDEFSEKSYDEASLNSIIKTAGLNKEDSTTGSVTRWTSIYA